MAKLYFRYSSMGAGKSLDLIKVAHNYEERDRKILIMKPDIDNRDGQHIVKSRTGLSRDALAFSKNESVREIIEDFLFTFNTIDCILIDESQFMTKSQVFELGKIVDELDIPIICYGLRSDFLMEPFEGSTYLMAIADIIEEIKTICWCGRKATVNARISDGEIVRDGEQVLIGGNESYISLCRKHFNLNQPSKPE